MNKAVKDQIVSSAMDIMSKALKRLSAENKCDAKNNKESIKIKIITLFNLDNFKVFFITVKIINN